jgi:hypothetical protein
MSFHCTEFIDTAGFEWERDDKLSPDRLCFCMTILNRAISQFINFNFKSFGMLGDKIIAGNEDGLFIIEGDSDNTCPIHAWFKFGYNPEVRIRLRSLVMNMETSNQVEVTIYYDQNLIHSFVMTPNLYNQKQAISKETRRVNGRANRGSFIEFKVANVGGDDLSVDSITAYGVNLGHRS